jgi:hypothetical protein
MADRHQTHQKLKDKNALGTLTFQGLPVHVENPAYTYRQGTDKDGRAWKSMLQHPYGEILGTDGADADPVDCFLGPDLDAETVFLINQVTPGDNTFDEHKAMIGFPDLASAAAAYQANYEPGWQGLGGIVPVPLPQFKEWLVNGDKTVPYKDPTPGNGMGGGVHSTVDGAETPRRKCASCSHIWQVTGGAFGPDSGSEAAGMDASDDKCPKCGSTAVADFGPYTDAKLTTKRREDLPTDVFADPDNRKWPLDTPTRIRTAEAYYNAGDGKEGYNAAKWEAIGRRIAHEAEKAFGGKYSLVNGQITKAAAAGDATTTICPNCAATNSSHENRCKNCGNGLYINQPANLSNSVAATTSPSPAAATDADADAGNSNYELCFAATDAWELLAEGDAVAGGLMKVRQLAMVTEPQINLNRRFIPQAVAIPALTNAKDRAHAGAILTEMRHPKIVQNTDGSDAFVDNWDRKTSRVDDVHMPDAHGRVYIDRTILDTPAGRAVRDSFKSGKPHGLSTRMIASWKPGKINGNEVQHFQKLHVSTWDDMAPGEMPAVPESRDDYQLLTDAMRQELIDSNKDAAENAAKEKPSMNEDIKAALDEYRVAYATADRSAVATARRAAADEIARARRKKEDIGQAVRDLAEIDQAVQLAGLFPGRPEPIGIPGNDLDMRSGPGNTPDVKVLADPTQPDQMQDLKSRPPLRGGDGLDGDANMNKGKKNPDGTRGTVATDAKDKNKDVKDKADEDKAEEAEEDEKDDAVKDRKSKTEEDKKKKDDDMDPEVRDRIVKMAKEQMKAEKDAARIQAVTDAVNQHSTEILKGLSTEARQAIVDMIVKTAADADSVPGLLQAAADTYGKLTARERLFAGGLNNTTAKGNSVNDPASPRVESMNERPPSYMEGVDKLLAAADDASRRYSKGVNPDSPEVKARRKWNRENVIDPWIKQLDVIRSRMKNADSFSAALDAYSADENRGEQAVFDSWNRMHAVADSTSIANFYNQPTVSIALLIQMFQDLTALQFVDSIGPGETRSAQWEDTRNGYGPGQTGWILKVPVESYVTPGGAGTYAYRAFGSYDAGLLNPENVGIPEGTVNVVWLTFATLPRMIAASITRQVRAAAGLGPLNYDEIGRHLYHIGADKNRRIDKGLYDEMLLTADEYGAVAVTGESVNLTNNSSYAAGGSVVVNLNPNKAASATPTGNDPYIQYGANVVGAVRLAGGASPYTTGTYFGSQFGATPVLPPRAVQTLTGNGQYTTSTNHPVAVTAPASAVAGYIGGDNQIYTAPQTWGQASAPGTATFAVDYELGVVVFTSGTGGVSGTGSLVTTAVTVSYSYSTNFDNFVGVGGGNVQQFTPYPSASLPQGITLQKYMSGLVAQLDATANLQGSPPRFSDPNLALMSKNVAGLITQADIWYQLNSPNGSDLYPLPDMFFDRNGIFGARHNSPWACGDRRILVGRRGATKYGVGIPAQVSGPYPKYDPNSGNMLSVDAFYLEEYSTIATPVVTDINSNQLNPPYRTIVLRSPNG